MKDRLLLVAGALAFVATIVLQQPDSTAVIQAQAQGAAIRGIITRAGTAEPIPDVNVVVSNGLIGLRGQFGASAARGGTTENLERTTKSDRDGRFTFRDLPAGQYTVQIEREGFFGLPLVGSNNYPLLVNTSVTVAAGQQPQDLTLSLIPGSAISGRVLDPDGRPVVGSNVQAFRLAYQNGAPALQATASTDTDDRGDYRLYRIPPGDYYLGVTPGQSGTRVFGPRAGRGALVVSGEALVRTFHPNAITIDRAQVLSLRGGEDLAGIGISVLRSPTIRISGQVSTSIALPMRTGVRGQPQTMPVQILLVPRDKNTPDPNTQNTVAVSLDSPADGKFELSGVIPGSYDLFARVNNLLPDTAAITAGNEPLNYFGRTSFEAGYRDVSGLSVLVRQGVTLKAYVTVDGSAAAANNLRVTLQPDDSARALPGYLGARPGQPLPGPDGMVTIPFVNEGLYRFQVTVATVIAPGRGQRGAATGPPLRDAYVEDIREGGLTVFDNGLLVGKEQPRPIEIVLKTNGGTILGTAYDAQQQLKAGATVVLVPSQERRQNIALYKTAITGAMGQFGFRAIAPGQYKLFAWEGIPTGAYQNAAFLAKYEMRGASITVNAAATMNAQVTVIPADR